MAKQITEVIAAQNSKNIVKN